MGNLEQINKTILREITLFSELEIEQLKQITSICILQEMKKNTVIFLEGDAYQGFYLVLKGSVKIFKISSEGKEYILHIIKPPNPFADVPLFEGGSYPANAETLEDCALLFIPKNEFIELIKNNPSISLKMMAGFAKRLRAMSKQIEELSLKEVTNRLARYLKEETEKNGTAILPEPFLKLQISKANLAAFLGTITETLSRTFKKLQNENIIRMDGKKIFILKYSRLKELSS